jgi:methionyl-tRNA formyltransferase
MRVIFVTHKDLGRACLEELADLGADIKAIYTAPEGMNIADQTGLGDIASANDAAYHRVESVNEDSLKAQMEDYNPDLLFVVGWSRLVDRDVIDIPSVAALGMHPAPLPRGRGRAPIAWSLIKGLDKTALSFFHLTEAADAGDIVGQESIDIEIEDDAASLYEKVVKAGRVLIRRYYPQLERGKVPRHPQNDADATWWPKRDPHQGLIDWTEKPQTIYDWIRGQTRPYPGAFSYLDGQRVTVWAANPPNDDHKMVNPGEIRYVERDALGVGAWEGTIELTEVQVGERSVPGSSLVTDMDHEVGDIFENARDRLR